MMSHLTEMRLLITILTIAMIIIAGINAECNVCQKNNAACVNSTSFYYCFNGTPSRDTLFHCNDGFDCTEFKAICVQSRSGLKSSCGDTTKCGWCGAHRNHLFACLSRITFQMCYGAIRPSGKIGYCPSGSVCDADSDTICVKSYKPHTITCDIVKETPTNSTNLGNDKNATNVGTKDKAVTTETLPKMSLSAQEICLDKKKTGLYPPVPADSTCSRYIYCFLVYGIFRGIELSCPAGTYYDIESERCDFVQPNYCN